MNIQNIKFHQELIKRKISLENELEKVNEKIEQSNKNCKHIKVILGYTNEQQLPIIECLFCSKKDLDINIKPIDASSYHKIKYGYGLLDYQRQSRKKELQDICIQELISNSNLDEAKLIEILNNEIKKDEEKNKELEKYLKK